MTYDAENRMTGARYGTMYVGALSYVYDALGQRVKKTVDQTSGIYVYDVGGQLLAEYTKNSGGSYTLLKEFVYGGGLLATELVRSSTTEYITTDHLGSTRVTTDGAGNVVSRHDYLPFGKEVPITFRSGVAGYIAPEQERVLQRFSGNELDVETGLQYFVNRYYSGRMGRFTSADPLGVLSADLTNPQSLNEYAYVLNNPCSLIDPFGLDTCRLTLQLSNDAGLSKDQVNSVFRRIDQIFRATKSGGNGLGILLNAAGKADLQLSLTTESRTSRFITGLAGAGGSAGMTFGLENPLWGAPRVYVANLAAYGPGMGYIAAAGSVGAHEIAHELGLKDIPFDKASPNIMMYDSMPALGQTLAFNNPKDPVWSFSEKQIRVMYSECVSRQPNQPAGGGGGGSHMQAPSRVDPSWWAALQAFLSWVRSIPVGGPPSMWSAFNPPRP